MRDAELRSALLRFFEDQHAQSDRFVNALATIKESSQSEDKIDDALDGQMNFLQNLQRASKALIRALGNDTSEAHDDDQLEPPEFAVITDDRSAIGSFGPSEQEIVTAYNEEPGRWTRTFRPVGFGADNVNEIWEKGGEPKFARKEGGIYNLVELNGNCYVFPEPGLRLLESYSRSEGLRYLFEVKGNSSVSEPLIALISPATVEESGGRWNVLVKGEIRGRS